MQQICHQLRSGPDGDMSFEEISQVVPWIELAHDQGQNLDTPQYGHDRGLPRIFKTHAWAPHCPVGALRELGKKWLFAESTCFKSKCCIRCAWRSTGSKKIIMVRDPYDVATSFYNFFNGWFFPSGSISLETFIMRFWLARGEPESKMSNASYFDHLLSWYERRNDDDVLFLFYEDVRGDLELAVRKVAAFMSTGEVSPVDK